MLRRLLLAAVATAMIPLGAMLAPGAVNAATGVACTSGVAVTQFAFDPPSVPLGSGSALTLVLQNCTSQTITGSTDWFGTYAGSGCPVLDAVPFSYSIAPGGSYTLTNHFGDPGFSGCQPTALRMSANVNVNGVPGTVTTVSATLQFTPACSDGIAIKQFSFSPATIQAGQVSTATLVLQNCTGQTIQGAIEWNARYTGPGGGIPPGCPAFDPVIFTYTIAPGATFPQNELQSTSGNASCQATALTELVNVSVNGVTGTAATASADLAIQPPASSPPPAGCHVTYTPNNWGGGFTANVTINNTGPAAISNWTLTFAFPGDQKITNAWNATVSQAGQSVSAANVSYNATIPAGGSQSFGFQGTWTSSNASPASFSVNGTACS